MNARGVIATTAGCLAFLLLMTWLVWNFVFGPADRGFFLILWGTVTGTGSFGSQ